MLHFTTYKEAAASKRMRYYVVVGVAIDVIFDVIVVIVQIYYFN